MYESLSDQTRRFRRTLASLEDFMRDSRANTERDPFMQFQDGYDAHLAHLIAEVDFPATAVPAWTAFRMRYVSSDGSLNLTDEEDVADAIALAEEVRQLVACDTTRHEFNDRGTRPDFLQSLLR